jgi:hypothetical protein
MKQPQPILRADPRRGDYVLVEPYAAWLSKVGAQIVIAANFRTDGASIPRIVWTLLGVDRLHPSITAAAVVHDAAYASHLITRAQADRAFYILARQNGLARHRAAIMWGALRAFGWIAWRRKRGAVEKARRVVDITTRRE